LATISPRGTLTPYLARMALAWYSWIFIWNERNRRRSKPRLYERIWSTANFRLYKTVWMCDKYRKLLSLLRSLSFYRLVPRLAPWATVLPPLRGLRERCDGTFAKKVGALGDTSWRNSARGISEAFAYERLCAGEGAPCAGAGDQ